jgi:DnaJ-domain-containing protein 1
MIQILRRLSRIAKSYFSDEISAKSSYSTDDDELKRIIDELNKKDGSKNSSGKSEPKQKSDNSKSNISDAYNILGVRHNATVQEIKAAYRAKMMDYHPDRTMNSSEEQKRIGLEKARQIINAYERIKTELRF